MLELIRRTIASQYGAALQMLENAIEKCPAKQWTQKVGTSPFWHVAYHVIFCTDMYLSSSSRSFKPQSFHRKNYNFLTRLPWPPFEPVVADEPYEKAVLLKYVQICRDKVVKVISKETQASLAARSGFDWLSFPRTQLHLYNIRHIQHHTGALNAFLWRSGFEGGQWVGSKALLKARAAKRRS
jgi:hypothetical protein